MQGAIYSLTIVLLGNVVTYWGRHFHSQYKLYRMLREEVLMIRKRIEHNRTTVESDMNDTSFPLLAYIESPIHNSLSGEYILNEEVSLHANKVLGNAKHYNRIIELGEKGNYLKRKQELLIQGASIHNFPVHLIIDSEGVEKPFIGYSDEYLRILNGEISKYRRITRCFPWYLFIMTAPALSFLHKSPSQTEL